MQLVDNLESLSRYADEKLVSSAASVCTQLAGRPLEVAMPAGPALSLRYFDLIEQARLGVSGQGPPVDSLILDLETSSSGWAGSHRVLQCSEETMGSDAERLERLLFLNNAMRPAVRPPSDAQMSALRKDFAIVQHALGDFCAPVYAEVETLIDTLISMDSDDLNFVSVTALVSWRTIVLNASAHRSLAAMFDTVVHEVTHSILYVANATEALVRNPIDDLFSSALRSDARPMDGVFHALVVTARMAKFWSDFPAQLATELGVREIAVAERDAMLRKYRQMEPVVRSDAVLSETGAELLDRANSLVLSA